METGKTQNQTGIEGETSMQFNTSSVMLTFQMFLNASTNSGLVNPGST
jgi:hypothetical protein